MTLSAVLIANRGEIAIRIARAAADLGLRSGAVYSEDDAACLHTRMADEAHPLSGTGAAAYLDIGQIVKTASDGGYDAVHPGYGFLSERAEFAEACAEAGLCFVGPGASHLRLFGDKAEARRAARAAGGPGSGRHGPRGVAGRGASLLRQAGAGRRDDDKGACRRRRTRHEGGVRGRRDRGGLCALPVRGRGPPSVAAMCMSRRSSPAHGISRSRSSETGPAMPCIWASANAASSAATRRSSRPRPAPGLDPELRREMAEAAVRLARSVGYANLGTFEFLVDAGERLEGQAFFFIEANARLQVEHTVTEAVTGVDLVETQFRLAGGATLAGLGLDDPAAARPRGHAIQARINMETVAADGSVRPESGRIEAYEPPSGPGVRVDGFGYAGYRTSTAFDSLLAKTVCHTPSPDFADAAARTPPGTGRVPRRRRRDQHPLPDECAGA